MASARENTAPLILTLKMDAPSQERFDSLRRSFFPPERNFIPAHLTLFHRLPGDQVREVAATVEEVCREQEPFTLTATGLLFMGRGVAYKLDSPELESVREWLAEEWEPWLEAQDRQRFRPHVTVQNKAPKERARALYERLQGSFSPFEIRAEGLSLWRYLGGPWQPAGTYPFEGYPPGPPGL